MTKDTRAPVRTASPKWLWTSRAGFEADLAEELRAGRVLAPALAIGDPPAVRDGAPAEPPTFGRQGFPIAACVTADLDSVAAELHKLVPPADRSFALQIWVPDSDEANRLADRASVLEAALLARLDQARMRQAHELDDPSDPILQICLANAAQAYIGAVSRGDATSTWPGGRARMRLPAGAPSRASAKLAEAFAWLGFGPDSDDVCVDLGAAPGGWTWLLLKRKARVIAVDRANLEPSLARDRRVLHLRENAFAFRPSEPVDWLFCDMVWKPAEVAKLLANWGKRGFARYLVANIKLPMKRRVAAVAEVRRILTSGTWKEIRTRQLYHDRDEITLHARRS
jgi:23S rRNA (cytidine2498-2'-O)-methyltransferase